MHQPFLNTATAQLNFMSSDQLREIFESDDKFDDKIDEIVSLFLCNTNYDFS